MTKTKQTKKQKTYDRILKKEMSALAFGGFLQESSAIFKWMEGDY
ncbi:hypothetical protein [Streptococcus loxodontisalivarius]|uniref:Uncharacterized protein n=1 Tax=Streptococcus loxodontisalivarius TaxID=1349415 RepID=A0ABS2PSR7_9STRE|nr:hypothetical protein [Streptococcus loxodontisalivarius]MBM7642921.1 hypothetical protein [Streptococcus loxodontisalivarius]